MVTTWINERQLEKRKTICELLLERCERKSFLHGVVTGDEKWVYYENPKRQKNMGTARWTSSINAKTQYSCSKGDAVYLVIWKRYDISRVAKTGWLRWQLFAINNNWWDWTKHWKKAARVRQTSWQSNFSSWQCSSTCSRTHEKYIQDMNWRKSYFTCHIDRT